MWFVVVLAVAGCTGPGSSAPSSTTVLGAAPTTPPSESARSLDSAPGIGVKVAWINEGAAGEDTWTAAHASAAAAVEAAFGDEVDITFEELVAPGGDEAAMIDRLVAEGNVLIIATSLAMAEEMEAGARRHPQVRFEQARGYTVTENLSTFTGAYEQSAYLVGMAGAAASETHQIGFIAQFPQPEMRRIVSAYALGARSVDPRVEVEVAWTNSWYDPAAEEALASQLVDGGADVLASTLTGTAAAEFADRCNVAWSGHDVDRSDRFADVWLTASITDWEPYYVQRVGEVLEDRWAAGSYYGTLEDGFIHLAPFGSRVTAEVRARIAQQQRSIEDGSLDVFEGPLVDNSGTTRVAAGSTMTSAQLLNMDWLVEGVQETSVAPDLLAAC